MMHLSSVCSFSVETGLLLAGQCHLGTNTKNDSTIITLPAMPTELQVISSVFIEDKVYVTGFAKIKTAKNNAAKDDVSRRVQVYSLREGEWSTLREAPNYNAPAAVINGRITLIGGRDAQSDITDVMSWLENEHSWVKMQMPTRRLESSVCYHDNLLLVTGGVVYSSQKKEDTIVVNTVDVHNFSSNRWSTPKALELPKALRSHQIVFLKDSLFLMSGAFTFPAPPEDGEMQYNPEAWRAQWSDVIEAIKYPTNKSVWIPITAPPFLRSTVVPCDEFLLSIGGVKDGMPQKAIYRLVDEKTDNNWTEVGSMSVGKYRHGVVPVCNGNCGAALFVAGGYVRSVPEGEETNVKSSSVELVLL